METRTWNRTSIGRWLGSTLTAIAVLIVVIGFRANAPVSSNAGYAAPIDAFDMLEGIGLTASVTDEDVAHLRNGVQFLHDHIPQWYSYVADAKPLMLAVDVPEGERGLAAKSSCCDEQGYALITFGDHFGDWSVDPRDQSAQARQITFLSTLIHESTHVRDRRTGRVSEKVGYGECVMTERAAFTQEVEFKRALLSLGTGGPGLDELAQASLHRQISVEASALEGNAANLYCLPFAVGVSG